MYFTLPFSLLKAGGTTCLLSITVANSNCRFSEFKSNKDKSGDDSLLWPVAKLMQHFIYWTLLWKMIYHYEAFLKYSLTLPLPGCQQLCLRTVRSKYALFTGSYLSYHTAKTLSFSECALENPVSLIYSTLLYMCTKWPNQKMITYLNTYLYFTDLYIFTWILYFHVHEDRTGVKSRMYDVS